MLVRYGVPEGRLRQRSDTPYDLPIPNSQLLQRS